MPCILMSPDTLNPIGISIILNIAHKMGYIYSCGTEGLEGPLCQKSFFAA